MWFINIQYLVSRHNEYKRAVEDKNFGPLVAFSMNRCYHGTRCIIFSDEYAGVTELGTSGRGRNTEIGIYWKNDQ